MELKNQHTSGANDVACEQTREVQGEEICVCHIASNRNAGKNHAHDYRQ